MNTPEQEALAKKRFLAMNLVRLMGVAMIIVGLLFALDKVDVPQPPRHLIGLVLIVIGMIDAFIVPQLLAKRWRS
jgi:xanthosine utilization system XapX-like protein